RILVQISHVRVSRSAVKIEVILLYVFSVVPFAVGEPEESFLDDGIGAVPERECKTQPLLVVADASDAVFTPFVGARPCLVVREIVPGIAIRAIVLSHLR